MAVINEIECSFVLIPTYDSYLHPGKMGKIRAFKGSAKKKPLLRRRMQPEQGLKKCEKLFLLYSHFLGNAVNCGNYVFFGKNFIFFDKDRMSRIRTILLFLSRKRKKQLESWSKFAD